MKKKKGFIALAVTIVSSLLLFTACKDHRSKGTFALDYISESLDLNMEQQESLNGIRAELMEQVEQMHGDKVEMYETLKAQLAGESIDKEVVRQLITEHRAKMDSVINLAVDRLAVFHGDLSPEQREKLITKLEKFEKHHSHRFN